MIRPAPATLFCFIAATSFLPFASSGSSAPKNEHGPVAALVVTAVDYEYAAVSGLLSAPQQSILAGRQVTVGEYGGSRIAVIRAGWGKAQASGATAVAIQMFSPKIVMMAGVAGGVDPANIASGDVVIVQSAFQYDLGKLSQSKMEIWSAETPQEKEYHSPNFISSPELVQMAIRAAGTVNFRSWMLPATCSCRKDGTLEAACTASPVKMDRPKPKVCSGIVATGDAFLVDPAIAGKLISTRQVVAVDMETAVVAEEASNGGIPFLGVRVIADVVNGSNENLYYCLKPFSGERLRQVMRQILEHLKDVPQKAGLSDVSQPEPCRGTVSQNASRPNY